MIKGFVCIGREKIDDANGRSEMDVDLLSSEKNLFIWLLNRQDCQDCQPKKKIGTQMGNHFDKLERMNERVNKMIESRKNAYGSE